MYLIASVMHFMSFFISFLFHSKYIAFNIFVFHWICVAFYVFLFHSECISFYIFVFHCICIAFYVFYFIANALHFTSLYLIKPTLHFTSQVECCIHNIVILIIEHISDWKLILIHFVRCLWQSTVWCLKQQKEDDILDIS